MVGASTEPLKTASLWLCDSRLGGSAHVPVKPPPSETPQGQGLDSRTAGPGNGPASQQRAARKSRGSSWPLLQRRPRPAVPPARAARGLLTVGGACAIPSPIQRLPQAAQWARAWPLALARRAASVASGRP